MQYDDCPDVLDTCDKTQKSCVVKREMFDIVLTMLALYLMLIINKQQLSLLTHNMNIQDQSDTTAVIAHS